MILDGTGHFCDKQVCITLTKLKKTKKSGEKALSKTNIAIDTTNQVILAHRVYKGIKHDSKDTIVLIKKTKKDKLMKFSLDRTYDSEK